MVDSYARLIAYAALAAAEEGSSKMSIDNVYILDGRLHIVYSNGEDVEVGRVLGDVFNPSIVIDEDGRKLLHFELREEPGPVPEDVVIGMERAEWTDVDPGERGDKYSDIEWRELNSVTDEHPEQGFSGDEDPAYFNSKKPNSDGGSEEYVWDTI